MDLPIDICVKMSKMNTRVTGAPTVAYQVVLELLPPIAIIIRMCNIVLNPFGHQINSTPDAQGV